jgi:FtsH-binding integral membrane protein
MRLGDCVKLIISPQGLLRRLGGPVVNWLQGLGTFALFLTTLGFFLFCALFHVLAEWRATEMGKHMMTFMVVCTVILTYASVVTAFTPTPPTTAFRAGVRMIMYSALCVVVWWRVRLLAAYQIQERRERGIKERV